uniref:Inhibitor of growth protein n=1 Tax=Xenopsylla cheopis TaxID=163159 RepID=A0A6M2DML9_XENCH
MINPVANQEAIFSATYVDNYLDCVENLPDDLQRYLSRVRELDISYRACVREVENNYESLKSMNLNSESGVVGNRKYRLITRIQQSLICAQELGDEKLQIVQQLQDLIDNKSRQLEQDFKNLDYNKDEPVIEPVKELTVVSSPVALALPTLANVTSSTSTSCTVTSIQHQPSGERASKRARRTKNDSQETSANENTVSIEQSPVKQTSSNVCANSSTHKKGGGKKKKRKSRNTQQTVQRERSNTPPPEEPDTIDPDEPTYCLCDQISFGEMILCDNDLCPIEWFHFSCVALSTKPKGKWYCPKCRGDRPNIMKPKAQFLKELERYNKQREEKS